MKKPDLCATKYCRNLIAPKSKLCHKCIKRKYRDKHPVRYAYQTLKQNAKRRGKHFSLTLEEFRQFCEASDYIIRKGVKKTCLTIDRIDASKGYTADNIQALSLTENSRKGYYEGSTADCPFLII